MIIAARLFAIDSHKVISPGMIDMTVCIYSQGSLLSVPGMGVFLIDGGETCIKIISNIIHSVVIAAV